MFDTRDDTGDGRAAEAPEVEAGDVVDELAALLARRERLDSTIADLIQRTLETEAYRRDGYSSMSALLRHRTSLHPSEAHRLVTRANGLAHTPIVAAAFASGALTGAQIDVLLEARAMAPDPFTHSEGRLVATAVATPLVTDLRKHVDYWLDNVAGDDLAHQRHQVLQLSSLRIRREGESAVATWRMDVEAAERVRAITDPGPPSIGDTRPSAQRRSDKLLDIVVHAGVGGPDLIVHASAEALTHSTAPSRRPTNRLSETSYGTFLTTDEIGRLACDCTITRVIMDAESQPLDVGRTRRLVTPALRKAVMARDLRCVFPGCDRPAQWCDVHHITPWSNGGPTAIGNLILLCRHHHTLVHEGGWTITGTPGDLSFIRSEGTPLDTNPPPRPPPPTIWHTDNRPTLPPGGLIGLIKQTHGIPTSRGSPTT